LVLGEIQCAGVTQGESHKRLPYFRRGGSGAAVLVQIASFRGSPEGLAVGGVRVSTQQREGFSAEEFPRDENHPPPCGGNGVSAQDVETRPPYGRLD